MSCVRCNMAVSLSIFCSRVRPAASGEAALLFSAAVPIWAAARAAAAATKSLLFIVSSRTSFVDTRHLFHVCPRFVPDVVGLRRTRHVLPSYTRTVEPAVVVRSIGPGFGRHRLQQLRAQNLVARQVRVGAV